MCLFWSSPIKQSWTSTKKYNYLGVYYNMLFNTMKMGHPAYIIDK